jgi:hypothetical protein
MPIGDCDRARFHHSFAASLGVSVAAAGLLSSIDSNHASVASFVVHTSRLGPAARYNGILEVSTVDRNRRVVAGKAGEDATFCDARPTSASCQHSQLKIERIPYQ